MRLRKAKTKEPTEKIAKKRSRIAKICIGIGALIAVLIADIPLAALLIWLSGIQLGFSLSDFSALTDTQRAQLSITAGSINFLLLLLFALFWLKRRSARFWKYMRVELYILLPLSLIIHLAAASYLFVHGQRGADYGCSQEVTLNQAYQATYPIYTDTGGGTAFAIDNHGTLLTAYHVIQGTKTIAIGVEQAGAKLTVLKTSAKYDLALLHYNKPTPNYIPLTNTYYYADQVYAIGWPATVDSDGPATITAGIISRDVSSSQANASGDTEPAGMSYIQTDAAVNGGNSGGPLLDTCGAVGVVDAVSVDQNGEPQQGIAYAISAATVQKALGVRLK